MNPNTSTIFPTEGVIKICQRSHAAVLIGNICDSAIESHCKTEQIQVPLYFESESGHWKLAKDSIDFTDPNAQWNLSEKETYGNVMVRLVRVTYKTYVYDDDGENEVSKYFVYPFTDMHWGNYSDIDLGESIKLALHNLYIKYIREKDALMNRVKFDNCYFVK